MVNRGTIEQAAEKAKSISSGAKAIERKALNVGAKAPTPGAKHFFRRL
jgi:hypothetical protein